MTVRSFDGSLSGQAQRGRPRRCSSRCLLPFESLRRPRSFCLLVILVMPFFGGVGSVFVTIFFCRIYLLDGFFLEVCWCCLIEATWVCGRAFIRVMIYLGLGGLVRGL